MKHLLPVFLFLIGFASNAQFGALDPSFGGDGIVETAIDDVSLANAVAVAPDGKILAAGYADSAGVIVRYLPDGSLDPSFGAAGVVLLELPEHDMEIADLALQADGKIAVCGSMVTTAGSEILVARFLANGSLDNSFGDGGDGITGISFAPAPAISNELCLQPDGKILVAGRTGVTDPEARIVRLTSVGLVDATFGTNGVSAVSIPGATYLTMGGMALQADGKILFCAAFITSTGHDRYVVRLQTNGAMDPGFGSAGVRIIDLPAAGLESASDVLVQADGKILVVGRALIDSPMHYHVRIARLLSDGAFDTTYGTAGEAIGPGMAYAPLTKSAILQSDGKLAFVGETIQLGLLYYHHVWRVNTNGDFDVSFGTDGVLVEPLGAGAALLNDIAQQADGKLLICGYASASAAIVTARLTGGPVGVGESAFPEPLKVFPNPVDRFFTLNGALVDLNAAITMRDMTGREVSAFSSVSHGQVSVDTGELPPGSYTIAVRTEERSFTARFIKE